MIQAIIVDDEAPAREIICEYLGNFETIRVIDQCGDGFSGLKSIQENRPDIVFLDIQMPKLTGFELLEVLDHKPEVIFTTAYQQYAIQAFEKSAVDYLLKPFTEARFCEAVTRALKRLSSGQSDHVTEKLDNHFEEGKEQLNRVVVKSGNKIHVIPVDKIHFIEAQDDYVMIHLEKEKYLKSRTMKYFVSHLNPADFIRVHRSYIVKIDQISRIEPYEKYSGRIILKDGRMVPVSRSGLSKIRTVLDF